MEIKAPVFPESINDGEVATWHVVPGEPVRRDQVLVDIETDKVVLEVVAPSDGTVTEIVRAVGDIVTSEEVLAVFAAGEAASEPASQPESEAVGLEPDTAEVLDESLQLASPSARKLADESGIDLAMSRARVSEAW